MKDKISRRQFVKTTAATVAAVAATQNLAADSIFAGASPYDAKGLPTRILGKTGIRVPCIGFGTGSRWMSVQDDDEALDILQYALSKGLYFWDTAEDYANDRISAEARIGKILPSVRDQVFMVTKTGERTADAAKAEIERGLSRLQTDHVDLLHIHAIKSVEDAEQLGEKGMVLEALLQLKSEGVIKHIGFSGHSSAAGMKRAAELYDFDAMMIALNHHGRKKSPQAFETLPVNYAAKKGIGVIGMKVVRPREKIKTLSAADLINYGLSLNDFDMINVGIDSRAVVDSNVHLIKSFKPFSDEKMNEMEVALAPFYRGEGLPWMNPAYADAFSTSNGLWA
ncbi:MAG: aldo/keto reductase [Opitutaceae bacterium]